MKQNHAKAIQLFTKACNANNNVACNNLGYSFENGLGVEKIKVKEKHGIKKRVIQALSLAVKTMNP